MQSKTHDEQPGYLKTLAAIAPAFAAKAIIGDLPKGAIEHAVESRLGPEKLPLLKGLKAGFVGRGAGRALGAGLGVLTAPAYLRGVQLAGSKDTSERRKGLALIGSTAALLSMQKGVNEGVMAARAGGATLARGLSYGARLGGARTAYKVPAALLYGAAIASSRKKKEKKDRFAAAALMGAGAGAAARAFETAVLEGADSVAAGGAKRLARNVGRAAAGGALGGALGGVVFSGVIDAAEKAMGKKKTAGVGVDILHSLAEPALGLPVVNAATKALMRAGSPGRVLGGFSGGAARQTWMDAAKARQLAIGIKEGLHGEGSVGWRAALSLGFSIPELRINREVGLSLGHALRGVPDESRSAILRELAHQVKKRPKLLLAPDGAPTPVLADIDRGVKKALGDERLYTPDGRIGKALSRPYQSLMYSGRGVNQRGLPAGWHPRKYSSPAMTSLPDLVTALAGAGVAGVGAATGIPGLGLVGWHGAIGGIKGLASRIPAAEGVGRAMAGEAVRDALLPGLANTRSRRVRDWLLDFYASPATGSTRQLTGALLAAGIDEATKVRAPKFVREAVNRKIHGTPTLEQGARLVAAGAAPGALGAWALSRKNRK